MSDRDGHILRATGLTKSFGKGPARVQVLRGLDLAVRQGEFLAVMGPSGCGKSTLLHVLGLMTPAESGAIQLGGLDVGDKRRQHTELRRKMIGFVFQRFNLLPTVSAEDNVRISLKVRQLQSESPIDDLFERLGISHVRDRKPSQMSIGEQQRVAVARALAHGPELLLADEPTGNLDSENSAALLEMFRNLHRDRPQTIVMITHSAEAAGYADRVVHMKDGRIQH
ncbi:MAG: ABC transporter ATP-binding protein [Phycisphaerae bacterium]